MVWNDPTQNAIEPCCVDGGCLWGHPNPHLVHLRRRSCPSNEESSFSFNWQQDFGFSMEELCVVTQLLAFSSDKSVLLELIRESKTLNAVISSHDIISRLQ